MLSKVSIGKWQCIRLLCRRLSSSAQQSTQLSENCQNQNDLFDAAVQKFKNSVPRITKIEVTLPNIQQNENMTLLMNKNMSTPYNCAQHAGQLFVERSIYAKVNDQPWDMHRPLEQDCSITFHHFAEEDTRTANRIFWRSCSFLLGKVIKDSFKNDIPVHLHSWPKPNYLLGSFIYDVQLPTLEDWRPSETELITLSKVFGQLRDNHLPIEPLTVNIDTAIQILSDNHIKVDQLKNMRQSDINMVNLYRVGNHIDFSVGPMIPNTKHLGRVAITAVHRIDGFAGQLYRFQGVGLPAQLKMHHYPFQMVVDRSKLLNLSKVP